MRQARQKVTKFRLSCTWAHGCGWMWP